MNYRQIAGIVAGIILVSAAGFLGFHSAQGQVEATPEAPPTIPVSRGDVIQSIHAPGQLVNAKQILLGMGASGPLAEISVQPGDYVTAGQLLATLGNQDELAAMVEDAQAELAAAKRALDELIVQAPLLTAQAQLEIAEAREALRKAEAKNWGLQEGHRASSETVAAAEAEYVIAYQAVKQAEKAYGELSGKPKNDPVRARARLKLAEARRMRDRALANLNWYKGHPTELQQSMLDAEIMVAQANLAVAESAWERLQYGPDPLLLTEAEARVSRTQAHLIRVQVELAGSEVRAPFDAIVMQVNAKIGETVAAHAGFILLSDTRSLEVAVTVIEEDLPLVEIGQSVELYFDARPDVQGIGRVDRIVPQRLPGDRPLYAVYITVQELPEGLAPGMTVDASIITAIREGVLRLPKALVRARSDGTAIIEMWTNNSREERKLQAGLRGDSYVEILAGLEFGDMVIAER
jgi:multidrug efflux pump subunit AcrA (membrane-fusion protein)